MNGRLALASVVAVLFSLVVAVPAANAAPRCWGEQATIVGTKGDDDLVGTPRADVIVGRGGSDTIKGRGGRDRICGKLGFDDLRGGLGADRIKGSRDPDFLTGGPGDDRLAGGEGSFHVFWPGRGDDVVRGGPTVDFVDYSAAARAVTVDLAAGTGSGQGSDTLVRIDGVQGSSFDDALDGNDDSNILQGGRGDDKIMALGNPEGIFSPDFLLGQRGDDRLDGGEGYDLASFVTANQGVTASLAAGTATGAGNDTLTAIEGLEGSPESDTLTGNEADNTFFGLRGDDTVSGRAGADAIFFTQRGVTVDIGAGTSSGEGVDTLTGIEDIYGSPGADDLTGDAGPNVIRGRGADDTISGLAGNDELRGGPGTDTTDGGLGTDACAGETESNCESDPTAAEVNRLMSRYLRSQVGIGDDL